VCSRPPVARSGPLADGSGQPGWPRLLAITDASLWWRSRVSVEPAVATTRQRALLSRELGLDVDDPLLGRYALDTHCALPGLAESDIRAPGGGL